jgi:5-formyltetrahydrofolate cyclo-ligase
MLKAAIRQQALASRKNISDEKWLSINLAIQKNLLEFLQDFSAGTRILSFQSILEKREIDLQPIHEKLCKSPFEFQLGFPRANVTDFSLQTYLTNEATQFERSAWGIWEPVPNASKKMQAKDWDVVLVPLLAIDLNGHRVGYGKGFYDRFLAETKSDCLTLGISMSAPIDLISDLHVHDMALDLAVSPEGIHRFNQKK